MIYTTQYLPTTDKQPQITKASTEFLKSLQICKNILTDLDKADTTKIRDYVAQINVLVVEYEQNKEIQGGHSVEALDIITAKGLCKESASPSEYFGENKNIEDYIKSVENPFNNIYSQSSFLYAVKKEPLCLAKDAPSLKEISKVLAYSQPQNIMYNLNSERCDSKRININKEKFQFSHGTGRQSHIVKSIDVQLDKKMPIIIDYESGFLHGSRAPARHASLVIGRRFNKENSKCEYLIRNSWGTNCGKYAMPYLYPENCTEGNIWVSQEVMYHNLKRTTFYTK